MRQVVNCSGLGPKASKMKWEKFIQPAVFEIVCSKTNNRFIGASMTPSLRRSTYFYHLRNIMYYDISNPFFGSALCMKDLEEHGIENFYFEIVKSMGPDTTKQLLNAAKDKHINKFPRETLYNRNLENFGYCPTVFAAVDKEAAELESHRTSLFNHMKILEEHYKKVRTETRKQRLEVQHMDAPFKVKKARMDEISMAYNTAKNEFFAVQNEVERLGMLIIQKNREWQVKYRKPTE